MDLVDLIILIGLAGFILFHLTAFTLYLVEHLQMICGRGTRLDRVLARSRVQMAEAATNTPQPESDSPSWTDGVLLCLSPSMRAEFSAFMDGIPMPSLGMDGLDARPIQTRESVSSTTDPHGRSITLTNWTASQGRPNTLSIDGALKGSVYLVTSGEAPSPASPSTNKQGW